MKILVTGSAGSVGRPVCRELRRRGHQVRGLDRVPTPGLPDGDFMVADIADEAPVREAVSGMNAVIHLAAQPVEAEFSRLVGPNVVGLYNVMNAAREEKVARLVLASSIMVISQPRPPQRPARVDEVCPRSHYAITKLLAEQMGEMYARCYGMSVLAVRLGWMVRNPVEGAKMRELDVPDVYCSAPDAGRFFALAAEAEGPGFAVAYAASRGGERAFDMEPARRLIGYQAEDRWPEGLSYEVSDDGRG